MTISVLLPFRNEAPYLEACLTSLAGQRGPDFELVAIDDGSTDASPEIYHSMAHRFGASLYLRTKGVGLVCALNEGLAAASGTVVARADGDDLYHPDRLALQAGLIEQGADMVGSLTRFFPRRELQGGFRTYEAWINGLRTEADMVREIYVENPIPHPALAARRSLLNDLGGYRDMQWPEDWDLLLRAHQAGARLDKVPRLLHLWREHPRRLCRLHPAYNQLAFIRCRCHFLGRCLARGPLADGRPIFIWGAGPLGRKMTTHLRACQVPIEGFIDIDPKKIGRVVRDRPVHAPAYLERHTPFVLGCVGKRGARYEIREALEAFGYVEERDFLLAA